MLGCENSCRNASAIEFCTTTLKGNATECTDVTIQLWDGKTFDCAGCGDCKDALNAALRDNLCDSFEQTK